MPVCSAGGTRAVFDVFRVDRGEWWIRRTGNAPHCFEWEGNEKLRKDWRPAAAAARLCRRILFRVQIGVRQPRSSKVTECAFSAPADGTGTRGKLVAPSFQQNKSCDRPNAVDEISAEQLQLGIAWNIIFEAGLCKSGRDWNGIDIGCNSMNIFGCISFRRRFTTSPGPPADRDSDEGETVDGREKEAARVPGAARNKKISPPLRLPLARPSLAK
ncbi:hypothetical protein C8F04DRAFT_1201052 [Mycena alexandri]|uniref:Uncharacterized protein n=1 Tax=Mycena alexandri TaxID=1745969 RepID=A0AAD6WMT0_9AGAR|nr:hypothetical protein C8F04DRAFT_1201052 [Mycena alexandri]